MTLQSKYPAPDFMRFVIGLYLDLVAVWLYFRFWKARRHFEKLRHDLDLYYDMRKRGVLRRERDEARANARLDLQRADETLDEAGVPRHDDAPEAVLLSGGDPTLTLAGRIQDLVQMRDDARSERDSAAFAHLDAERKLEHLGVVLRQYHTRVADKGNLSFDDLDTGTGYHAPEPASDLDLAELAGCLAASEAGAVSALGELRAWRCGNDPDEPKGCGRTLRRVERERETGDGSGVWLCGECAAAAMERAERLRQEERNQSTQLFGQVINERNEAQATVSALASALGCNSSSTDDLLNALKELALKELK